MRKAILWVVAILASVLLVACNQPVQPTHQPLVMHSYREHVVNTPDSSNDWIYWYILYSDSGSRSMTAAPGVTASRTAPGTPMYYYRSSTPVANFNTTTFTRVTGGALPKDVKEEVEKSEEVSEEQVTESDEPADVAQDEAAQGSTGANTGSARGTQEEENSESNSNESSSNESSSSESSSSSSDSSSSDSGGGGGGDGD